MIIFTLIPLVAFIISLSLAIIVYSIKPRTKSNIIFIFSCLSAAFLSLFEFSYRSADSYQTASYWINLSIIWPILIAFIVHFVLLFTEQRTLLKNLLSYIFIYLPALIFSVLDSVTNSISSGITHEYWGWTNIIIPGPVWILSSTWTVIMIIVACYFCWSYFFQQRHSTKRVQALLIAIGISIPLVIVEATELVFSIMHIEAPDITTSGIVVGCIFIGIGLFRYGLFKIDPLMISESILEKISDLVLVTDKDEIIIKVNSAVSVMLGYNEEEIKGQKFELITMENKLCGHKLLIDEKGKISDYETTLYTKSGDKVEVSVSVALLKSKRENNIGLVIVARDITEKKRTESELVKHYEQEKILTQKLQDEMNRRVEFTRALVHELKTPLTPIMASSDLLVTVIQEPAHLRLAKNIYKGAAELNKRIDELLDTAKGEMGILQLDNGQVDMLTLLQETVEITTQLANQKDIVLKCEILEKLPLIWADRKRLQQVLLNIMNNALKWTPQGGEIMISAKTENRSIIVQIKDTGLGIPEDKLNDIFERYKRVEDDRQKFSGLGLGLYLCKNIIELHQGKIWVNNNPEGGSNFGFSIPVRVNDSTFSEPHN